MTASPAFLIFARDRLDFRFQRMTLAAQGAVWKLECLMWTNSTDQCSLPDNNEWLARVLGTAVEQWLKLRKEVQSDADKYFKEKAGRLFSSSMMAEAARQRKHRKLQSEKGKRSAQQRLSRGSTAVRPDVNLSLSSSLSPSSRKKKEDTRTISDEAFIQILKGNSAYHPLDIDVELGKLDAWLLTPRGQGKKKTRARIVNWLNRAADEQRPLAQAKDFSNGCVWKVKGNGRRQQSCGEVGGPWQKGLR